MQRIIIPKYIFNFLWKRSGSDIVRKAFGALPPTFAPLIINTPRNQAFRKHTPFRQQHETTQFVFYFYLFLFYFIFIISCRWSKRGPSLFLRSKRITLSALLIGCYSRVKLETRISTFEGDFALAFDS